YNEFVRNIFNDIKKIWKKLNDDDLTKCLIFLLIHPEIYYDTAPITFIDLDKIDEDGNLNENINEINSPSIEEDEIADFLKNVPSILPNFQTKNDDEIMDLFKDIYWKRKTPVEMAFDAVIDSFFNNEMIERNYIHNWFIVYVLGDLIKTFPQLLSVIKLKLIKLFKRHDENQLWISISILFYGIDERYENKIAKQVLIESTYDILRTYFYHIDYDTMIFRSICYTWGYYCKDSWTALKVAENIIRGLIFTDKQISINSFNALKYFGWNLEGGYLDNLFYNLLQEGFKLLSNQNNINLINALALIESFQCGFELTKDQLEKIQKLTLHDDELVREFAEKILENNELLIDS
ncbi:MAG: hypothetical protein ACP6IY_21495, partial [Promethearchaeia archaeon]